MSEDSSDQEPRQEFAFGEGPDLLGQMLAHGAEVFGSGGEKVGDLKDVGQSEFTVSRGALKRDLRLPVTSVGRVVGSDRIELEITADQAEESSRSGADAPGKADDFSESPISEGIWETLKGRERGRGGR